MCIDWIKNAFLEEETKVALVGLQKSGKTTFLDTVLVSKPRCICVCFLTSIFTTDRLLLCNVDRFNIPKTSLDAYEAVNMHTQGL